MHFCVIISLMWVCIVDSLYIENPLKIKKYDKCGTEVSSNKLHRNPWVVFLSYYRNKMPIGLRCAGTLVSQRHVVTAAHCVKIPRYTTIKVLLGEYDVESEVDCEEGICGDSPKSIAVVKEEVHPEYRMFENDIAVLWLAVEVSFTDFIRPICLPTKYEVNNDLIFTASGWGEIEPGKYSRYKKLIPLAYRDVIECINAYSHTKLPQNLICAGGNLDLDTCNGDSGGPLMLKNDGRVELWGITNAGHPTCGSAGFPGVYTRVFSYLDWLHEVMI